MTEAPARSIVRVVMIVVAVVLVLYLIYLLRRPINWVFIAIFLAVALSAPVNWLQQRMRRGFAIALVYLGLLAIPLILASLIVPPFVREGNNAAQDAPRYADDVSDYVQKNRTLRNLNEDYDITTKLQQEAEKRRQARRGRLDLRRGGGRGELDLRPRHDPDPYRVPARQRAGMGPGVTRATATAAQGAHGANPRRHEQGGGRLRGRRAPPGRSPGSSPTSFCRSSACPSARRWRILVFLFDLIPLVGATIAAVLVGIVTVFNDFPTVTIIWVIWSIVYQQVENTVIQPRIQARTVQVHPFVVMVSVLFGATLLGVLGALVAIPVAASIQIAAREWWDWHRKPDIQIETSSPPPSPPSEPGPAGASA